MEILQSPPIRRVLDLRVLSAILRPLARPRVPRTPRSLSQDKSLTTAPRLQDAPATPAPQSPHPSPSSVSQTEVVHFSRLASSWWDPHGPSRLLHLMNPLRHDFIQTCLSSSSTSASSSSSSSSSPSTAQKHTYLDIGCGGGIFASSAARLPSTLHVTGIDPTPSVISIAKQHQRTDPALSPPKLTYLNTSIEAFDPQPQQQQYAILTLFETLEHIPHPAPFLQNCTKHLALGGWLIGSTIARHPLSFVTTKIIAEAPLVGIVPRGTHNWDQYINPEELGAWFRERTVRPESQTRADGEIGESGRAKEEVEGESWGDLITQGVIYVPGLGWKMVNGSERYGNYFFGIQKLA